jgi:hypothetical protein
MQILANTTVYDMIAAWLQAEYESSFKESLESWRVACKVPEKWITDPDLTDPKQNAGRACVFQYRTQSVLFRGFPKLEDISWYRVVLSEEDLCARDHAHGGNGAGDRSRIMQQMYATAMARTNCRLTFWKRARRLRVSFFKAVRAAGPS